MATLEDGYAMANDGTFMNRVAAAVSQNAYNIITVEADTEPDHAQRYELAQRIANEPNSYTSRFSYMCAANPTIGGQSPNQENVPDGDIQFVVNQVWPAFFAVAPAAPLPPPAP